jgi:hypothetical protein
MKKLIRFVNFWPGFNPHDNVLLPLLNFVLGKDNYLIIQDRKVRVDLEVGSLYGPKFPLGLFSGFVPEDWAKNQKPYKSLVPLNAKSSLLFTAEPYQEPYYEWEYHLGYKFIEDKDKEAYFPLWYLETDLFGQYSGGRNKRLHEIEKLLDSRTVNLDTKNNFVCSFIGNRQIMRLRTINLLKEIDKVDVYGRSVDNYVEDKINVARKYFFQICFENTVFPGYITEKIIHSYISENIPLWMGLATDMDLNKLAFINLLDFDNLAEFQRHVNNLFHDKEAMLEIIQQPLLKSRPSLDNITKILRSSLNL